MSIDSTRLVELMNYNSLSEYELRLWETIDEFKYVSVNNKAEKKLRTLKVALRELKIILENITKLIELNNMFVKIWPFEPYQQKLEQNKEAKKAIKEIKEVHHNLRVELTNLQKQFFKQMELCLKLSKAIKNKIPYSGEVNSEYQEYKEKAGEFETICAHSILHQSKVPFDQEKLSVADRNEAKREHDEKAKKIDEIYSFRKEQEDDLEKELYALSITLNSPSTYFERQNLILQRKISEEVSAIEKVLSPSVIAISAEALDKLRASDKLTLDLETIQSLLKNPIFIEKKYSKYNEKIDKIKDLLKQALNVERERKEDIKHGRDKIEKQKDYATSAVRTYNRILTNNQNLQQEQIRIRNGQHGLQVENERLKEDAKKTSEEVSKSEQYGSDRREINKLYERIRHDKQTIKENEAYMDGKMSESAVESLPIEYTDMKKQLQKISSLYQINPQGLSTGGMSK